MSVRTVNENHILMNSEHEGGFTPRFMHPSQQMEIKLTSQGAVLVP